MHTRVQQEIVMLQQKFPSLEHGKECDWVLLPVVELPVARFNKSHSKVLFRIPAGYPQTGPDNFFVDSDLRLANGTAPAAFNIGNQSGSGAAPVAGSWAWFSWHPQQWRAAAKIEGGDNLYGFVSSILLCLRGEESA
jgi:hypothetical protein